MANLVTPMGKFGVGCYEDHFSKKGNQRQNKEEGVQLVIAMLLHGSYYPLFLDEESNLTMPMLRLIAIDL